MDRNLLAPRRRARKPAAFSLIELLVVIAVMTVLMTIGLSQALGGITTLRMKQSISSTVDTISRARQTAMTLNREVLVRIYKVPDQRGVVAWREIEFGIANAVTNPTAPNYVDPSSANYKPAFQRIGSVERLPEGFVFHPSTAYSTLLNGTNTSLISGKEPSPEGGTREFVSFLCVPEGRTPLTTTNPWTLTIVQESDVTKTSGLPDNFATLQIEPRTARVWLYRP